MKRLIVISAPSGVGKSTLIKNLMPSYPKMTFSVSATTRAPRPAEHHGKDYFFLDPTAFQRHIDQGDFIEHTHVYGNSYGTLIGPIRDNVQKGLWPLLDVDSVGLKNIQNAYSDEPDVDIISILVLPTSIQVLYERLRQRGTETEEVIQGRMRDIYEDIAAHPLYTYVLINDQFDDCMRDFHTLLHNHPNTTRGSHPTLFAHDHAKNLLERRT